MSKFLLQGSRQQGWLILVLFILLTTAIYWPGLSGGFLFDDFPNIVDNVAVQPQHISVPQLTAAALSSPSSEFKRPLASLSFAANYLTSGLDPFAMKLTNLLIHLANGLLIFILAKVLIRLTVESKPRHAGVLAALVAGSWLLLPINITAVLYVVQRMESLANLCVLAGLLGYVVGRDRMLRDHKGSLLAFASLVTATLCGLLAKETAVMLPLYAVLVEFFVFQRAPCHLMTAIPPSITIPPDRRVFVLFVIILAIPLALGLIWLLPSLLQPATWMNRNFTLRTRLLSEARVVIDYIRWIVLPNSDLSFYHDDFEVSTSLWNPWTTSVCILLVGAMATLPIFLRKKAPLFSLGIALFLACHLLTATVLPLELIYEHRNYFASFGLILAIVPLIVGTEASLASAGSTLLWRNGKKLVLIRYALVSLLLLLWAETSFRTAYAWGSPLRLAKELAERNPNSPRALYELGRSYIIYSQYEPTSPFVALAYPALEQSALLPNSSILPEQALIFMNARMKIAIKDAWWKSMTAKLAKRVPGVQDESSLEALTKCKEDGRCDLPSQQMLDAFIAAASHPNPSARLLAIYGDFAWNVLHDKDLGERLAKDAVERSPREAAYLITLIKMDISLGKFDNVSELLNRLKVVNVGRMYDSQISLLKKELDNAIEQDRDIHKEAS
jgi:hypothetical protein